MLPFPDDADSHWRSRSRRTFAAVGLGCAEQDALRERPIGHEARCALYREGFHAILRVMIFAALADAIYQLIVFKVVYLPQLVFIVIVLAILPYLILRGPAARVARRWYARSTSAGHGKIQHG